MPKLTAFKAYDVRGRMPDEINEHLARDIGRAYAAFVKPRRVAVGYDIRLSSPALAEALKEGLKDGGCDVLDIGLWGTEGVYYATFAGRLDGGIMVTASHNPPDYNGMKFVREESRPISADNGLKDMAALIESGGLPPPVAKRGTEKTHDVRKQYLEHLLGYIDLSKLRKLKVVVNAGNGGAGLIVDQLAPHLPFEFI
jgi:phosphomannomutase